ncbi:MAG: Ldh family oxidoreductase [Planctomycetia bacterium]|nr:Ldh family oxidoreductase [Planctomycetia bacterium]
MPLVPAEQLKRLITDILERVGASPDVAGCVADHLVEANLAGHDSHGVMRIPQYLDAISAGKLRPDGRMQIVAEASASAAVDGGRGFGQVIARDAMLLAIKKARAGGVGAVSVRNCSHTGRIGTYTRMAAQAGLVGIVMVNSGGGGQSVAPFGGTGRRLSTNPISIAAPSGGPHPILLDIASSVAPEGKVRTLFLAGKSVPPGWMIDARGNPTTNPADFYAEPAGALLPLGGAVGYKGFGLGFMIDILAGALSEAGCSRPNPADPSDGMLGIALDVQQFTPLSEFKQRVAELAQYVKSCPTAPGFEQIYVPGEIEARERERHLRDGVSVDPTVWEQIEQACSRLGIRAETST